jgi:hypothetical protein
VILTDRETIKLSLRLGSIIIDPSPAEEAFSSTSVDLTLDQNISEFKDRKPWQETSLIRRLPTSTMKR